MHNISFEKESKGWKRFLLGKATGLNDKGLETSLRSPNDKSIDHWNVTQMRLFAFEIL